MKKLCLLFSVLLLVTFFVGCNKTTAPEDAKLMVTTEEMSDDQRAIAEVIMAYDKAYYEWDSEAQRVCATPEFPIEDTEMMLRNAFGVYVDQGDMVEEDIEKYLEIEKASYQKGAEQLKYSGWKIVVSDEEATALVTYEYPNIDANMPSYGEQLKLYRDELFVSVCDMDEATAKASLSAEEFSATYLQVIELDYAKRSENAPYVENTMEFRLKKVDGKWLISELVLPEA